jgi:RecA/RadA recombinase
MKKTEDLSPLEEMALIQDKLGYKTFDKPVLNWLNTGNPKLNAALGSEEFGIPYGRMMELIGAESHGKTLISLFIAALAQRDGAKVAWVDLERSFDETWVTMQGVEYNQVYLFQLLIGHINNEKQLRLETAEELFTRVEMWMARRYKQNPTGKMLVVVDSIAAMLVEDEAEAGLTEQNMRTNSALPMFLSKFLRRWVALVANYNAMVIFVNQVRETPGAWGNPERAPGGRATRHYCSIRATVRRLSGKKGKLIQGKDTVGLRGVIKNIKNKAGGGSREGAEVGYETRFGKKSWKFTSVQELKREVEEEEGGGEEA